MPTAFTLVSNGRVESTVSDLTAVDGNTVWIDCINPTDAELAQLDALMGFEVPNRLDISEIELSSRLYREDDGTLVMIANLLPKLDNTITPPRPAAFILRENMLLTIRYSEFYSFERARQRLPRESEPQNAMGIFCRLLEAAVAERADNLEMSMRYLEELTSRLFLTPYRPERRLANEGPELSKALRQLGRLGEAVSNIRESITSLQRAVNFARGYVPDAWWRDQRFVIESARNDLFALSDEAAFIMNKLSFNLDAVLGMINIDEAKIIRLLSVVTMLLTPPMLIGAIYGMNFQGMPELEWPYGYAFSLGLMVTTALVSILYLKRKRWL